VGAPFGLKTLTEFQRTLTNVCRDIPEATIYIDDLNSGTKTLDKLLQIAIKIINTLTRAGLRMNIAKCKFLQKKLAILGFLITRADIYSDPKKVQAIVDWPRPTTGKQIQRFLGTVNFFRFLSQIAQKLHIHYLQYSIKKP